MGGRVGAWSPWPGWGTLSAMVRIGITGGIGMGKSAAAEFVEASGTPVIDSDRIAREIVEPGCPALEEIREAFGAGVIGGDGGLDRARLASLVFADPGARTRLEGILHPRIRTVWEGQLTAWEAAGWRSGAVVIPLLYETAAEGRFDAIVCVACTAATQRVRLCGRGWSEEEIRRRIGAQWAVEEKVRRAGFLIWTEPPLPETGCQWECIRHSLGLVRDRPA